MSLKVYDYTADEMNTFNYVTINTPKGSMNLKLLADEAPNTVANFVSLVKSGFYDGLNFHRVIPNFMAQGGCPQGRGTGGPDWSIACECDKNTSRHQKGTLSMAHAGRNTGGSQFFICFVDCPHLDRVHTIFGQIPSGDTESFNVLDKINGYDKIESMEIKAKLEEK